VCQGPKGPVLAAEGERAAEREARDDRVEASHWARGSGVRWLQTFAGVKVYGGRRAAPGESWAGLEGVGWVER